MYKDEDGLFRTRCPACNEQVAFLLEEDISLPPTGGDFDWCESQEVHACPACGARVELRVRVWLGDGPTEVFGLKVLPPLPHPSSPDHLAWSPDGAALASWTGSSLLLYRRAGDGWEAPIAHDWGTSQRESQCPPFAWSPEGRLLLANGEILTDRGVLAGTVPLPDDLPRLIGLGWCDGTAALAWRRLLIPPGRKLGEPLEWEAGVDLLEPGERVARHVWKPHSGFVMSGRVLFDPHQPRLWILAPPHHGSHVWHVVQHDWTGGALVPGVADEDLPAVEVARLVGDTLLLGVSRWSSEGSVFALCWLDADALTLRRECALARDLFGDFPWLRDVVPFGDGRLAVLTGSASWTLRDAGDRFVVETEHEVDEVTCLDVSRDGSLAVGGKWALKVFDPEPEELVLPAG